MSRQIAPGQPTRIQRRRTKGSRAPEGAVYVGRPTRFGNPYRLIRQNDGWTVQFGDHGGSVGTFPTDAEARRYATEAFRVWIQQREQAETLRLFRALLHGRDLTCWCPLPEPGQPDHCHATVLLGLVNGTDPVTADASGIPDGPIDHEPLDYPAPGVFPTATEREGILRDALRAAGVELGAYDERIAAWLARWDWSTVAVITSWVKRAGAADT